MLPPYCWGRDLVWAKLTFSWFDCPKAILVPKCSEDMVGDYVHFSHKNDCTQTCCKTSRRPWQWWNPCDTDTKKWINSCFIYVFGTINYQKCQKPSWGKMTEDVLWVFFRISYLKQFWKTDSGPKPQPTTMQWSWYFGGHILNLYIQSMADVEL